MHPKDDLPQDVVDVVVQIAERLERQPHDLHLGIGRLHEERSTPISPCTCHRMSLTNVSKCLKTWAVNSARPMSSCL